jgi:uncharacterized RDD family membrane protein YckC
MSDVPPSAPPPSADAPAPAGNPAPAFAPGGVVIPTAFVLPPGAELSGWWKRVGASFLDALISLPFLVIFYVLIVSPILMGRDGPKNGQTWGKQAMGIRVLRNDGQPFSYGTALLRDFVIKSLLFGAVAIVQLVNLLWPLWDAEHQALHDKLAGTHVLKV